MPPTQKIAPDNPSWDTAQYLKFADLRLRPALDLMNRLDRSGVGPGSVVYDLGCGAGNVTRLLAERFAGARVIGVDGSPDMLAKARAQTPHPDVSFRQGDLGAFSPDDDGAPAVLFSNAAYHWLPGHEALFPALAAHLPPGGQLAIQMPRNHGAPSHRLMREAAEAGPWRDALAAVQGVRPVADPTGYWDILRPHVSMLDIWETEYAQPLTGADPVLEWTKGTGLRPYLDALQGEQRDGFVAEYARLLRDAYPKRSDGTTIFPFRRIFVVARR